MCLNGLRGQSYRHDDSTVFDVNTYGEKQVASNYASNKPEREKNTLTVLDGESAAQPTMVAPGSIGPDETRLEDFDLIRLQAQHCHLV